MKLADYLSEAKLTDAEFGRLIGLSQPQVNRIRRGLAKPNWDKLPVIRQVTGGKVRAEDFEPEPLEAAE